MINDASSRREDFELFWVDEEDTPTSDDPIAVYVAPGESRVVRVPRPKGSTSNCLLRLRGDSHSFDNAIYFANERREERAVLFVGPGAASDHTGLLYYLDRVFVDTPRSVTRIVTQPPGQSLKIEGAGSVPLVIVTADAGVENARVLTEYMKRGGTVLYVVTAPRRAETLAALAGVSAANFAESNARDVMLSEIRFDHPLFAPFSGPQFNDFTKIHFWKHRVLNTEFLDGFKVLAKFEGDDVAVAEKARGNGRLVILTSGWHPADSQLARSSKFVPLMLGLLEGRSNPTLVGKNHLVFDRVPIATENIGAGGQFRVRKPDGSVVNLRRGSECFEDTDLPGLYTVEDFDGAHSFAVNIDPLESKTAPMQFETLEQLGCRLADHSPKPLSHEDRRQMYNSELENRQKLWRWLVLAAVGLLIVETLLASRSARCAPVGSCGGDGYMSMSLFQALERVARRFRRERLFSSLAICWIVWAVVGFGVSTSWFQTAFGPVDNQWLLSLLVGAAVVSAVICACIGFWQGSRPAMGRASHRGQASRAKDRAAGCGGRDSRNVLWAFGLLAICSDPGSARARSHARLERNGSYLDTARGDGSSRHRALSASGGARHIEPVCTIGCARPAVDQVYRWLGWRRGRSRQHRDRTRHVASRCCEISWARAAGGESRRRECRSVRSTRRGMTRSLEDPTFAGRVESVETPFNYRVEFSGKSTEIYQVKVFEYPELTRADAKLAFPTYTSLEPKTVEDIRHVTAVEGTNLTLLCRLNKEVATAELVAAHGGVIALTPTKARSHVYETGMTLSESMRFKVRLVDTDGRTNKLASEIVVNVTRNHPPVVKMTQPAHDVRVSPVEELKLKADIEDDFGLTRHGLTYSLTDGKSHEIVLKGPASGHRQIHAEHLLEFETLRAAPDQLVTYFFWGEDVGPDGQTRRTSGDMYFAEVRHFEEIFRQGEQPPGGSAQSENQEGGEDNARTSDQLAELQKEIINGTWKLLRRETGPKPTEQLADDGKVLKESEQSAIDKADQLGERLQDAASKSSLELALRMMKDAENRLAEVADKASIPALNPALAAEQAAYRALLKLRAREFQVIRNNARRQQQGGRILGGRMAQRQLQQLELADDENRYEEQRSARAQQANLSQREREQRETRQVLNRLRELAQRQSDVNERLKELQSALEAAKTPQARQEIERQLKRLRDQQQQILRDTDELMERMEQEGNRQPMSDAREQIEQGREHERKASEALEQGQLSEALHRGRTGKPPVERPS